MLAGELCNEDPAGEVFRCFDGGWAGEVDCSVVGGVGNFSGFATETGGREC